MEEIKNIEISPIFLGLLAIAAAFAGFIFLGIEGMSLKILFTALIIAIWVIGLCFHEFSHALISYIFGDKSVLAKGYLTLNPLLFSDIRSSIIFPIMILLIGGLPLPGGAVYLRHDLLKTRTHISLTYLAGPFANMVFGLFLGLLCFNLPQSENFANLRAALGFSAFLQIYSAIFNLLPVPSFDGFGAISAFLPPQFAGAIQKAGAIVFVLIILAIFAAPQIFTPIARAAMNLTFQFGANQNDIARGFDNFLGGG